MPHPRFKHQWEEDSYWKHYENYKEELLREQEEKDEAKAEAQLKAQAQAQLKDQAQAEGWQIVGKKRQKLI
jgi:hypothetical protein